MNACNYLILQVEDGGTVHLTTDSPASHHGIPVLRVDADGITGDFGPADVLETAPLPTAAAYVVCTLAQNQDRTPDERDAARRFLRQWPDGPQLELPDMNKQTPLVDSLRGAIKPTIYRVTLKTTDSVEPGRGGTYWQREVIYCGTDRTEALVTYHRSEPTDHGGPYGNPARVTVFELLETSGLEADETGEMREQAP